MTATITEQEVDTDWLHEVDSSEKHAIPCDNEEDDNAAVWKITLSCCGHVGFICQECMDRNLEAFASIHVFGMICNLCEVIHVPASKIIALAERI